VSNGERSRTGAPWFFYLLALLLVAGATAGGYAVGHSRAPTGSDAQAARAQANRTALGAAAAGSRHSAYRRGQLKGTNEGADSGRTAGLARGSSASNTAAQAEQTRIALATPHSCGNVLNVGPHKNSASGVTATGVDCSTAVQVVTDWLGQGFGSVDGYSCSGLHTTTCASGSTTITFSHD